MIGCACGELTQMEQIHKINMLPMSNSARATAQFSGNRKIAHLCANLHKCYHAHCLQSIMSQHKLMQIEFCGLLEAHIIYVCVKVDQGVSSLSIVAMKNGCHRISYQVAQLRGVL